MNMESQIYVLFPKVSQKLTIADIIFTEGNRPKAT